MLSEKQIRSNQDFSQILKYNEAILTDLPINMIAVDTNNRIKLMNNHAKMFFGFDNYQYHDLVFHEIIPEENQNFLSLINKALKLKKQSAFYQVSINLANSDTINNLAVYPIFEGKLLIGNIIIIEDITKQETLRQKVILSENLASVGLLAAGVAHEINNPLDIMGYYLQHIRFVSENKEVLDAVENIDEEINSVAQIVGNLITFSDKKNVTAERFDVNDLLCSLIGLLKHKAKRNNTVINLNTPSETVFIDANRNEIKQVLLNLVKNSFEAMPEGGTLSINVYTVRSLPDQQVEITFDDSGEGIEESKIKDIFFPFYSTKNFKKTNYGLGLSISYGIISVKNLEGKGCQFKITLPLARG